MIDLSPALRQVLKEGPAPGDVERLRAAADREDGQPAPVGGASQGDLGEVELAPGRAEGRVRVGAVGRGMEVGAARQAER